MLREIERDAAPGADVLAALTPPSGFDGLAGAAASLDGLPPQFEAEMQALTGVDQIGGAGEGFVSGGKLGIVGQLGQTRVNLHGRFQEPRAGQQLRRRRHDPGRRPDPRRHPRPVARRRPAAGRLAQQPPGGRRGGPDRLRAVPGELEPALRRGLAAPTSPPSTPRRATSTARTRVDPIDIPAASRTWRVEGSYTTAFGSRGTLQTGLRYREREFGLGGTQPLQLVREPQSHLDLFGRGGVRLEPAVLLEYGLYTTLSDGSVAITPQGGLVLQIGRSWQLSGSMSRRVHEQVRDERVDFLPVLYQESDLCQEGSQSCYQVRLAYQGQGNDQASKDAAFSIDAVHRTVGETLRLYFSDDFFDRFESLYLVPGDEIPELRMSLSRRVTPQVLATLASSLASGGGGMFLTRDQVPFENSVQYLVTSLDTQFRGTSTGVFLAFHHLSQQLQPVGTAGPPAWRRPRRRPTSSGSSCCSPRT